MPNGPNLSIDDYSIRGMIIKGAQYLCSSFSSSLSLDMPAKTIVDCLSTVGGAP
jgi:hypothetical protein